MIKVNLATRKESGVMGGRRNSGHTMPGTAILTRINIESFNGLAYHRIIIPGVIALIAFFALDAIKQKQLEGIDSVLDKLKAEVAQLQVSVAKFKTYDLLKKDLDEDELTIRTKLETIQKLANDRAFVPRLLLSISKTIPRDVWLSQLSIEPVSISFTGKSMGLNQISDFMKVLGESTDLKEVTLKNAQQTSPGGSGRFGSLSEISSFEIHSKRR